MHGLRRASPKGKLSFFLTTALMRASRKIGMKISACIRLKDRIVDVKEGASSPRMSKSRVGGGIKKQSTISNIKTNEHEPPGDALLLSTISAGRASNGCIR